MLSAGMAIIQYTNEASPPERKFAVGVLIWVWKSEGAIRGVHMQATYCIGCAIQSREGPHEYLRNPHVQLSYV